MNRVITILIFLFICNHNAFSIGNKDSTSFPHNIKIFFGYGLANFSDDDIPDNKPHTYYDFGFEATSNVSRTISLGGSLSYSHISKFINAYTYFYKRGPAFPAYNKVDLYTDYTEYDICFLFNYLYCKTDNTTLSAQLNAGVYVLDEYSYFINNSAPAPWSINYLGFLAALKTPFDFNISKKIKIGFAPCWSLQVVSGNYVPADLTYYGFTTYYKNAYLFKYYLEASISFRLN